MRGLCEAKTQLSRWNRNEEEAEAHCSKQRIYRKHLQVRRRRIGQLVDPGGQTGLFRRCRPRENDSAKPVDLLAQQRPQPDSGHSVRKDMHDPANLSPLQSTRVLSPLDTSNPLARTPTQPRGAPRDKGSGFLPAPRPREEKGASRTPGGTGKVLKRASAKHQREEARVRRRVVEKDSRDGSKERHRRMDKLYASYKRPLPVVYTRSRNARENEAYGASGATWRASRQAEIKRQSKSVDVAC